LNLQRYLDEFCYKFNRRRYEDGVFDRLIVACITTSPRIGFRRYDFV
ncbi:MAG: IS1595 family transposase, partial [Paludibacteraceae bacterium]|nr:IS1595 family transposase [Paludibacteraceae bacterium]MBR6105418.1 IS1595 family transposase [Paludibacteraceae bacterium]